MKFSSHILCFAVHAHWRASRISRHGWKIEYLERQHETIGTRSTLIINVREKRTQIINQMVNCDLSPSRVSNLEVYKLIIYFF